MSECDDLIRNYRRELTRTWQPNLSGAERVWFVVYSPRIERQMRLRLPEFATTTREAGHAWHPIEVTHRFGAWIGSNPNRERYFSRPAIAASVLPTFEQHLATAIGQEIDNLAPGDRDVVALTGTAGLFALARVSSLVATIADRVPGRLVVFFPGSWQNNQYRLLDARDGWNYQAIPITASEGERFL